MWIKWILRFLSLILLIYLLMYIFYSKKGTLQVGKHISVLPTHNSTILETTKESIEIKVIGKHNNYYKIITPDKKIGWIRKNDVE